LRRNKNYYSRKGLVVIHSHVRRKDDNSYLGKAHVDILKFDNGIVIEHWDVVQRISEDVPANNNTMFKN